MLVWPSGEVAVSVYMDGTRGSGVLASAGDMLEISVVGSIGGVYNMQGFGFENGRRVINRSPWVGKGSCRRAIQTIIK